MVAALPSVAVAAPIMRQDATQITLQGAVNVRDVGGYVTYTGDPTKSGRVIRADALGKLTDADVQKLGTLGVKTVVDFRTSAEVQGLGADRLPAGVSAVARPIDDGGIYLKTAQAIGTKDPVQQQALLGDGKAEQIMRNAYTNFLGADATAKFSQTIKDVAAASGPFLYHCTSGKDRTGWMTYVLLRAVGVPESITRQDYLLSNQYRAAADAALRDQLKAAGLMQNPDLLIPLQIVSDDYLNVAVDQMNQKYGDFGNYLTKGLGLDAGTILRLHEKLVG
ncbi:Protein-tyrosine-phosphatase [Nocardia seriolae]|uniref:Protein tyrosine phosphatase n=1 Tax=Nocardia seriolae TaxID=37332 RepID=A0ABC8ASW8_9NOCA|nr:Protein-tyrosine-phosphatase [Nocardia seriolae]BAW05505.1 protein tyrosine phosphatase [Nocardia seriolae]GAM47228.1 protein tyrosine phosphatase [Nocardia seriolae]GAP29135.1 protein-tyrosine phosphatase [Nocardia seriolae]GEM24800.1 protein-tyrosine-phosphatase [Nocardia seriolae NBRC 15557]